MDRFKNNFKLLDFLKDKNCLCLGARSGAEVKALIDLGNKAIGIDLEPGTKNEYVQKGDFHNLQFKDQEFDVVYTNAFDHVFDLDKALQEISRVLKDDGYFILEIVAGYEEGGWPGDHESAYWAKAEDFVKEVEKYFHRRTKIEKVPYVKGLPFRRVLLSKCNHSESSSGTMKESQ